jgi:hypothetical protein
MPLSSVVAALLLLAGPSTHSTGQGPPVAPRGWVSMRLVPVTTGPSLGDSLVFRLEFTNRGSAPVGLWNPPPYHADGWDLVLRVRRPGGGQRILFPIVAYQALYSFADSDLVVLKPNESLNAWVTFRSLFCPGQGREKWYGGWQVLTPAGYARYRRVHYYETDSDVMGKCFDRPGIYRIDARLILGGAGTMMWRKDVGWPREPAMCEDSLRAVASFRIDPKAR